MHLEENTVIRLQELRKQFILDYFQPIETSKIFLKFMKKVLILTKHV